MPPSKPFLRTACSVRPSGSAAEHLPGGPRRLPGSRGRCRTSAAGRASQSDAVYERTWRSAGLFVYAGASWCRGARRRPAFRSSGSGMAIASPIVGSIKLPAPLSLASSPCSSPFGTATVVAVRVADQRRVTALAAMPLAMPHSRRAASIGHCVLTSTSTPQIDTDASTSLANDKGKSRGPGAPLFFDKSTAAPDPAASRRCRSAPRGASRTCRRPRQASQARFDGGNAKVVRFGRPEPGEGRVAPPARPLAR